MRGIVSIVVVVSGLSLSGCAGVGLTLFGVGAGTAAGAGVNHTLSGIAYKTFSEPRAKVQKATETALNSMGMKIVERSQTDNVRNIIASAGARRVEVEIEELTAKTTRMRVTVIEADGFFRDSATATEIILQTAAKLDSLMAESNLSQ